MPREHVEDSLLLPPCGEDKNIGVEMVQVDENALHAAFVPFGDIKEVAIPMDYRSGKRKPFGFVTFQEPSDASDALDNMHRNELFGKTLNVSLAQPHQLQPGYSGFSSRPVWELNPERFASQLAEHQNHALARAESGKAQDQHHVHTPQPADVGDDPMEAAEREARAALDKNAGSDSR